MTHGFVRAAMLCKGEVEDAKSIDEFITLASIFGNPIPDIKDLDFKIASGLWKILTGNFQKHVITDEDKAQSEKRAPNDKQIDWMIYDVFKISNDNEVILDFSDLSNIQTKTDSVQAFDTKWDDALSAGSTDRPTDGMLESLYKMQVEKSEEMK